MPSQVLQNKFTGVNQRSLKTEGLDFSKFNGCFPYQVGIQNRIFGKALLAKFDAPIYSIFQFWTPQGYLIGLQQTDTVSKTPWSPWTPVIPVDGGFPAIPPTIPIIVNNPISGYDGCTGLGFGYEYVIEIYNFADFLLTWQNYLNTIPASSVLLQNCGGYAVDCPPGQPICIPFTYPTITSPTKPTTTTIETAFAGFGCGSSHWASNQLTNNPSPPFNYLINYNIGESIDGNTEVDLDLSPLYTNAGDIVYITANVDRTVNGVTETIAAPLPLPEKNIYGDYILSLDAWSTFGMFQEIKQTATGPDDLPGLRKVESAVSFSSPSFNIYRKVGQGFGCPITLN